MAASIDDSILKGALGFRRDLFFETLSPGLSAAERDQKWAVYLVSLSQSSTPSRTNNLDPAKASLVEGHAPPLLAAAAPEAKRRRLNTDASEHARHVSLSRQHSLPSQHLLPSHPNRYQDDPSPFITTEDPVPTPALSHWYNTGMPKQLQAAPHNPEPLAIPPQKPASAKRTQTIPVREYKPEVFGPSFQMMPANLSSIGRTYNQSPSTLQPSPFLDPSPRSSSSGNSFGLSTSPTSTGSTDMARMDSLGGASFYNDLKMIRISSAASKAPADQIEPPNKSSTEVRVNLGLKPSPEVSAQPPDPVYDISQAGAQFSNHPFDEAAPNMQRQMSTSSRPLHPKANVTPSISRTPSSADGHEVIRVPSSNGSYKEAIKIRPVSSFIRPSGSDKVKCTHKGCVAQLQGFKGVHEMQRHFDRAHKEARHVFVCAPLADEPDFLSKSNCKHCQAQKRYNEDYNAGEHLRRMHFNPKQAKTRRGQLKPEEKRGGKGGGTEPPMPTLRDYMVTFKVDMNGVRVSDPQRVNPASNLIMPTIADGSERFTEKDQTTTITSSNSIEADLESSDEEHGYSPALTPAAQPNTKPRFAGNDFLDLEPAQFGLTVNAMNISQVADVSNSTEDQLPFDPLVNDPMLFEAILSDNSPMYNDELADLFSPFS